MSKKRDYVIANSPHLVPHSLFNEGSRKNCLSQWARTDLDKKLVLSQKYLSLKVYSLYTVLKPLLPTVRIFSTRLFAEGIRHFIQIHSSTLCCIATEVAQSRVYNGASNAPINISDMEDSRTNSILVWQSKMKECYNKVT
jgi:hypothetical protein